MLFLLSALAVWAAQAADSSSQDASLLTQDVALDQQELEWNDDDWLAEMAQKLFPAPQYVDVVWVGDRSGSMGQYQGSSQAGTREFIEKHRENAIRSDEDATINGVTTHLTVVTFDDTRECPYSGDAQAVQPDDITRCAIAMSPRGRTRLYDTAVEEIDAQLRRMMEKENEGYAVHAVFALLTDGVDNGSYRFGKRELNDAVTRHQQAHGVECLFVQAGTNAMRIGAEYGFAGARTLEMGYEAKHAANSIRAVTEQTTSYTREAARAAVSSTTTRGAAATRPETAPARGSDDYVPDDAPMVVMPMTEPMGRPMSRPMSGASSTAFNTAQRIASGPAGDYNHYNVPQSAPDAQAYTAPSRRVASDATDYNMRPSALTRPPAMPSIPDEDPQP